MRSALQFLAVVALGLGVSWVLHRWVGLFDSQALAFAVWFAVLFSIGFIVDRRTARRQRHSQGSRSELER